MSRIDEKKMEEIAVLWTNAQPAVSAFVLSIVPRFNDADDILQQVAVSIVKNFHKYDKKYSFVGWAIGIAKNEILMYRRKHSKRKFIFDSDIIEKIAEAQEKESAISGDIQEAFSKCIKQLKGRGRQILEMRYHSELSVPRIAQKLGMTHGSIYTVLHRVRLMLQGCINRQMIAQGRNND